MQPLAFPARKARIRHLLSETRQAGQERHEIFCFKKRISTKCLDLRSDVVSDGEGRHSPDAKTSKKLQKVA
jgi:hypothetical protein